MSTNLTEQLAQAHLRQYPSLKWLADDPAHYNWRQDGDTITITPTADNKAAEPYKKYFPVVVTHKANKGVVVSLPALGIQDYPRPDERPALTEQKDEAIALVCNRFYRRGGHSYLYLHYPKHPKDDKIFDFNAGSQSLGQGGMQRTADFTLAKVSEITDPQKRGISSFVGFPLSRTQAKILEADAAMNISGEAIKYSLFNTGVDSVNCLGFALSRLQDTGESFGLLQGEVKIARPLNPHDPLPHYRMTIPDNVNNDIWRVLGKAAEKTSLAITNLPMPADQQQFKRAPITKLPLLNRTTPDTVNFNFARTANGLLVGAIQHPNVQDKDKDKFIVHDFHLLTESGVLDRMLKRSGAVEDLSRVKHPPVSAVPLNTHMRETALGF
jgi:hypothetical protein